MSLDDMVGPWALWSPLNAMNILDRKIQNLNDMPQFKQENI